MVSSHLTPPDTPLTRNRHRLAAPNNPWQAVAKTGPDCVSRWLAHPGQARASTYNCGHDRIPFADKNCAGCHLRAAACQCQRVQCSQSSTAKETQHHLHPRRRPGLRRPRLLRSAEDQDAEPRPAGGPGHALHPGLCRQHRLRPVALLPDDRPAHRPLPNSRQRPCAT